MAVMMTERPVRAEDETEDRKRLAQVVRAAHDEIDPPEGYRVEIIEGLITMSACPIGKHANIVRAIRRAVEPTLPEEEFGIYENITLEEPEIDRYIPDLQVWPIELLDCDDSVFPGDRCLLAVEVTSPKQERRDYAKAAGYARSGVPVYLVVDRKRQVCVVFTEPEAGTYRDRHEVPFGKPVTLPLDTPATFDTSRFS